MFSDLKNIEEEIDRFKRNMDSVDGLMAATKEVCGKMDHQINQVEQLMTGFSVNMENQKLQHEAHTQQNKETLDVVQRALDQQKSDNLAAFDRIQSIFNQQKSENLATFRKFITGLIVCSVITWIGLICLFIVLT